LPHADNDAGDHADLGRWTARALSRSLVASVVLGGGCGRRMICIRTRLILGVALAFLCEGVTLADEPEPEDSTTESAAGATGVAPDPTLRTVPAPAPTPAPLLPAPNTAASSEEPETKILLAEPRFGDPDQIALSGALSASIGHLGYDRSDSSSTAVSVEPAFDYFTSRNFSQGASFVFRYTDATSANGVDSNSTTLGVSGRIGRNVWLGGRFSFWPRLALDAWRTWLHFTAPTEGFGVTIGGTSFPLGLSSDFTEKGLTLGIHAPFLLHLARHFFVGFGPDAYIDVIHSVEGVSNRRRFVGASSTVGGWF
jgi:hypothetical protein